MPLRSMTGFGAATRTVGQGEGRQVLGVELRSVNQRFFEIKIRQPFGAAEEHAIRRAVEARLGRGRVDVMVHLQGLGQVPGLERGRLDELLAQLRDVERQAAAAGVQVAAPSSLEVVRQLTGRERAEAPAVAPAELPEVLGEALGALTTMRVHEGSALTAALAALADELEDAAKTLRGGLAGEAERLQDRMAERLTALCVRAGVSLPGPERVAQEVAALVQRGDIEEELARLASHLGQWRGVLAAPAQAGQGKTLDFLSQELFREITTIGSKITSHAGSAVVIAAKGTVERMREQVQNVE